MNKKILIGCFEVPSYGGASTSGYALFEKMLNQGVDVSYVNIISDYDADYFRFIFNERMGNPKGLKKVYNCILSRPIFHPNPKHTEFIDILDKVSPDLIIGIDFLATVIMKRESINIPHLFLACGCDQAAKYIMNGEIRNAIELELLISNSDRSHLFNPKLYNSMESVAVEISDLIITNSDLTKKFYSYYYPQQRGKIFPEIITFAEWIYEDALNYSNFNKQFSDRDIDLIFVSSIWSREVKNYPLMKKLVTHFSGKIIHIIGEVEEKIIGPNYHGLITDRDKLFKLLGRSKTVVSTSILDVAPGLLYEASAMGCNIISSKNCGNWMICNNELSVIGFGINEYIDKINLSLSKKYDDNIGYFLNMNSYNNLIDIVDAM